MNLSTAVPSDLPADGVVLAAAARGIDAFGAFHIVVEDFNLEDHHLQACIDDPDAFEEDRVWGRRMLELTIPQRAAVLALANRYFEVPA